MTRQGAKPATKSDKKMSKTHIKAGKKLLKMSEKYNEQHMMDHKKELMKVRKALHDKYTSTRS